MSMRVDFKEDVSFRSDFEEIAGKAIDTVRNDVAEGVKNAVKASISHSGPSELLDSVRTYKPEMTKDKSGMKIRCTFSGNSQSGHTYNTTSRGKPRKKKVSNANKAFWLEYGVAGRQAPKPWQDRAVNSIEAKVTEKIQAEIERIMEAD